ncbi:ABC transporter substrate-binding protein [Pusillimonas noertemannii]|uniref:Branched-chain amino acid transport system substrate-binding protein n=1 Tax=Pusillimonas noertemannii TaxID=305977 RepID=A0A2U1CQT2_9BURK|nr:ABC transporter substrate-binding protein [Pusillimonas noertemannii]NYT67587.1 ABC transporter substrate-binding protein [Pusillimonas noertemannii]PVY68260.1 branched-chain amino acid transport system substrate-binding protein [Pusillimonas noertemannii]TFL12246.1 ABC transporter substrate-binding protein [Pusillimonas noertemannii]
MKLKNLLAAVCLAGLTGTVFAQTLKIGVTIPKTGPAASLGAGAANSISIWPETAGGVPLEITILDDASDPTGAVANVHKLLSQNNADVIVGSSITPSTLAMLDVVGAKQVPLISLASSTRIVDPVEGSRKWAFKVVANDSIWVGSVLEHMQANGVKTLGFIGFSDALGESWLTELQREASNHGVSIEAIERFNPRDTSVNAQVVKLLAAKVDAVLVGSSGTPSVLPALTLRNRGYKGKIYLTSGAGNHDVLRVGGAALNGVFLPVGRALIWKDLPDSDPFKKGLSEFAQKYEAKFGENSIDLFAAQAYDAYTLLDKAVPSALTQGKPGTSEFREALRDALENLKDVYANAGVYNFSPTDHSGLDKRASVMAEIKNGKFVPVAGGRH